jgi:hypothetical protein
MNQQKLDNIFDNWEKNFFEGYLFGNKKQQKLAEKLKKEFWREVKNS